jgi:hypothetical protein
MSSISAYAAFVQKHDLAKILADNDFKVTASGDIAMWAGSPQQGDDRCNAMLRLLSRWFANTKVLETLLDLVGVDNSRKQLAQSDLDAVAESAANGEDVDRYHALILEGQTGEFGAAACAGAVMVVLSNLLQRYKKDLHAESLNWDAIEPVFGGCSFGQIVVAAANNFRHHDEWALTGRWELDGRQKPSISVIEQALDYTLLSGRVEPWRRNACADLVEIICGTNFVVLQDNFIRFARGLAYAA